MTMKAMTDIVEAASRPIGRLNLIGFPPQLTGRSWSGVELEPRVQTYARALALPLRGGGPRNNRLLGCVYDQAGRVVVDSERAKINRAWAGNPSRLAAVDSPDPVARLPGRTFFAGHLRLAFGHVLLELVPRFWPDVDYAEFDQFLVHPTRLNERLRQPLPRYVADLLAALGVDASRVVLADRPLEIAELTVSTAPIVLKHAIDPRALHPFDRIADALAATPVPGAGAGQAVYLSRAHLGGHHRRARNEAEIEAVVVARGFQVLHPQEMSICEQVAAVRGADVVAACDGSALHLAAFARPGTTLVGLDSRVVENQLMIDIARGLNAVHVLASVDGITQRDEPWTADLDLVRTALAVAGSER